MGVGTGIVYQFALEVIVLSGAGPAAPSISCGSPPVGLVGIAYAHVFPVVGGAAPLVYSVVGGALPPGLALNGATGAVSGIPTASGTFPVTVQVVDSLARASQVSCTIVIAATLIGLRVLLRGVKRTRKGQSPEACVCPELEHVKRAV